MTEIAGFRTTEIAGMTFYICLNCGDPCSSEGDANDHQTREIFHGSNYLDKFFGDKDVITSDDGVYLKPVGKAEDNPFDHPDSRPTRLEGKTWD